MDDLKSKLLYELQGEKNSFLISIRVHLEWDHSKLMDVLNLMYKYILNSEVNELLERDVANGFWFFSNFVKDWSSHEGFRHANQYSEEYFNQAYEVIYFLSDWYFSGECPFIHKEDFKEEIQLLNKYVGLNE